MRGVRLSVDLPSNRAGITDVGEERGIEEWDRANESVANKTRRTSITHTSLAPACEHSNLAG